MNKTVNISYIIKEKQRDIIILSSDDETEEATSRPNKIRKLEGSTQLDPINLSEDEDIQVMEENGYDEDDDADSYDFGFSSPVTLANEAFLDLAIDSDSACDSFKKFLNNTESPLSPLSTYSELMEVDTKEQVITDMVSKQGVLA